MPTSLQTKFLEDSQGNKYAAVTTPNAVRWPDGSNLTDKLSVMGASGSGHASGLVPDTPSTAGTTKFLREDGTWAVPSGGGLPTGVNLIFSLANIPTIYNVAFAMISANQSTVSIDGVSYNSGSPIFGDFTDGKELHVFVSNEGSSSITITLPTEIPYVLCGDDSALTLSAGEIAEINFVSTSSVELIFVKAVKSAMTYTIPT